ncbi:hypothetical protein V9K67_22565 [Paraflavisolibacter sp. H34]|uniref:hypothetical protein n=1 Tax=Huijunlia imazamoxiresistens TaxID=3127457 RepID=UPI0030163528
MADSLLIILLCMGILILIVQWLLFLFQVKTDRYWDTPTKKHQQAIRQEIYNYLYRYPSSIIRYQYPHLAETAEATHAYEQLNLLYQEGKIDEGEYNRELEKLLPKVNIEQDF